ncbi:MAG: efflux RND transporter periplasmic adaptor subunit [Gammaproteobacteria bacterium]|nr:efflux RND transporter periplasmic adaptor subunit [Gammaproteobacteria bacterium]
MKSLFTVSLLISNLFITVAQATETEKVQAVSLQTLVKLDGQVEAISRSTVSAQVSAKVKNIYVDVDDRVTTGTLLLEMDDTELKAQLAKANAALNVANAQSVQAQSEYKRLQGLKSSQFVSDSDMTKAEAAVQVAQANINLAKAQIAQVEQQLTYTKIIAPYSGVVTARHIEVGETANMGQPLLTGFALNQNRLILQVPNSLIGWIDNSQSLLAQNTEGQWVTLNNLTIAPSADPLTHTVMVRANIDKTQFKQRPGSFVKVAVATDERTALVVPEQALVQQGDLNAVYVQLDDAFVLRQVMVGEQHGDNVEVISGLREQDVVVKNGAEYLAGH